MLHVLKTKISIPEIQDHVNPGRCLRDSQEPQSDRHHRVLKFHVRKLTEVIEIIAYLGRKPNSLSVLLHVWMTALCPKRKNCTRKGLSLDFQAEGCIEQSFRDAHFRNNKALMA